MILIPRTGFRLRENLISCHNNIARAITNKLDTFDTNTVNLFEYCPGMGQ
jgi:hypothetical protein